PLWSPWSHTLNMQWGRANLAPQLIDQDRGMLTARGSLAGGGKEVAWCDMASGTLVRQIPCPPYGVAWLQASPDGRHFAVCGAHLLDLWDGENGRSRGNLALATPNTIQAAAFSPDGRTLLTCDDGAGTRLWDVASRGYRGGPLRNSSHVTRVQYSADG